MSAPEQPQADSDYGSELDYTDETLLAQLDAPQSFRNVIDDVNQPTLVDAQPETLSGPTATEYESVPTQDVPAVGQALDDKQSLWDRYRKHRGWGALSVSDFASPSWCEYQHTYRLASKSWLPPLERPATITTSNGLEISIDTDKTVKREKVLNKGTEIHLKLEKQVMGDVEQVKVETEGKEAWWALRLLNTIVSLSILMNRGRVREIPVVGFVQDHLVFGVIDEIERREVIIPRPLPTSKAGSKGKPAPSPRKTPSKSTKKNRKQTPDPKEQTTLLSFFSPSPSKAPPQRNGKSAGTVREMEKGVEIRKEKEDHPQSEDLFLDLTEEDDEADLRALAEIEQFERMSNTSFDEPPKTRVAYIISDTKSRFNRSLPPEPETAPARVQLMLYHRLFTSMLQPEPPPSSPSGLGEDVTPSVVPTGPFRWSRLFKQLDLDPDVDLPESFLKAVEPVIEGSELEDLLDHVNTLRGYVTALWTMGQMISHGLSGTQAGEVLEEKMEISYVLREDGDRAWKGRRSTKKDKKKVMSRKAKVTEQPDLDDEADLAAAIRLSLQDSGVGALSNETSSVEENPLEVDDDSQLPFLANPSLPLPFALPPASSQSSAVDVVDLSPTFSLPTNSQANESSEPKPAVERRKSNRYHLRTQTSVKPRPSQVLPEESPALTPRSSPRASSLRASPPTIIGTSRFTLSIPLLSSHLSKSLSYWRGEREPLGVSIDQVKRCRTCEFEEGCEWREGKAREMEERNKELKRSREREVGLQKTKRQVFDDRTARSNG